MNNEQTASRARTIPFFRVTQIGHNDNQKNHYIPIIGIEKPAFTSERKIQEMGSRSLLAMLKKEKKTEREEQ